MILTKWFIGNDDLTDARTIRAKVFINEQNVPQELEIDDKDEIAQHIVIYDDNKALATGRLLNENGEYLIGRIAVIKEERKNGYGNIVVKNLIEKAVKDGAKEVNVHAQIRAIGFYEKLGFVKAGEEYIEEGTNIPHIHMVYKI